MSFDVGPGRPPRSPHEPCLAHKLGKFDDIDDVEPHEDRGIALEVWRREIDVWCGGDQRILDAEVGDHGAEDRPFRGGCPQRRPVARTQRPLPDEALVFDTPVARAPGCALAGLRQRERSRAYVLPRGHERQSMVRWAEPSRDRGVVMENASPWQVRGFPRLAE